MDEYGVSELPAPVRETDDTCLGRGGRAMTAPPAPVLTDSEVARLQRVLEDVRFSLERGYWQAALAAVRAALTCDEATLVALHERRGLVVTVSTD